MNPSLHPTFSRPAFTSRVVPVIVITDPAQAVPMAHALLEGGVDVMEITLRHAADLPAIEAVARHVPQMHVGAGTVTRADEMARVQAAGAKFALSPGMTDALVQAALACKLPFMPGVMTPGEVMAARDYGFNLVKLFPAAQAGGLAMLKALGARWATCVFAPRAACRWPTWVSFCANPMWPWSAARGSRLPRQWLTAIGLKSPAWPVRQLLPQPAPQSSSKGCGNHKCPISGGTDGRIASLQSARLAG